MMPMPQMQPQPSPGSQLLKMALMGAMGGAHAPAAPGMMTGAVPGVTPPTGFTPGMSFGAVPQPGQNPMAALMARALGGQ